MPVLIGTATDHEDLYNDLVAWLQTAGPTGPDWTLLDDDATRSIFVAPGLTTTEEIHVGFGFVENAGTDSFALSAWMFRAYSALVDFQTQPGMSTIGYHPLWDTSIPYWFIANGQRVIIVTKVSTVYTASYLGKMLPYGTPGQWPQPYYRSSPQIANTRWSETTPDIRNFYDPGRLQSGSVPNINYASQFLDPAGVWRYVANFFNNSGSETPESTSNYMWPYNASFFIPEGITTETFARWREMRDNVDGSLTMFPLILMGEDPSFDFYGELDGAFAVPGFGAASEDTIDFGGDDYLIVQNIFRTSRFHYAAIRLT